TCRVCVSSSTTVSGCPPGCLARACFNSSDSFAVIVLSERLIAHYTTRRSQPARQTPHSSEKAPPDHSYEAALDYLPPPGHDEFRHRSFWKLDISPPVCVPPIDESATESGNGEHPDE